MGIITRSRLASVLDVQSSNFLVNKSWFCAMTRHYANNILLARNLPCDSDVGPWSIPSFPVFPPWFPKFPPRLLILPIPHILTQIPHISIHISPIPISPFLDSPFRFLHIAAWFIDQWWITDISWWICDFHPDECWYYRSAITGILCDFFRRASG